MRNVHSNVEIVVAIDEINVAFYSRKMSKKSLGCFFDEYGFENLLNVE